MAVSEYPENYLAKLAGELFNLISLVDDTYDGYVRDGAVCHNYRANLGYPHLSYVKDFKLGTMLGPQFTGRSEDAVNRLQYNYYIIKEYCQSLQVPRLDFELQVRFTSGNQVNGFQMITHFTEDAKLSDVASLVYFQIQHIVQRHRTTVPEFKLVAYEDLPYDEQQTDN